MPGEQRLRCYHGVTWTANDAHGTVGRAMPASAGALKAKGINLTLEQIIAGLVADVVDAIGENVPWLPGAEELLTELRRYEVPCALVTMAYSPVAHRIAAAAPAGSFETVVAGDDVQCGKPHPDPYLLAADRLSVEPSCCVAIEDSLNGTQSATAAVMPVLIVPG